MGAHDADNRIIKRAYQTLRQLGWLNGCVYFFCKLLVFISNGRVECYKYYLVAQPVLTVPLVPPGKGKKIEIRLTHKHDQIVQQFPRPTAVIKARFEQGAICLVAMKEGQFIGFLWLLLDNGYQEDEVRACFIPDPAKLAAWDFDVYVAPDFRFGMTFLRLWDEAYKILRESGVKWSCSRISAFNINSLGSHTSLGALVMSSAFFLCAGRWQVTLASTSPYVHLSSNPNSYPKFRLITKKFENIPSAPPRR